MNPSTTLTVPAGSTLTLDKPFVTGGSGYQAVRFLAGGQVSFVVDGALNITSHNNDSAIYDPTASTTVSKTGTGTMTVTKDGGAQGMHCAVLAVSSGTLTIVNTATVGGTAGLMMNNATANIISVDAGATLNVTGGNTAASNGIWSNGASSLAIINNGTMNVTGGLNGAAISSAALTLTMRVGAVTTLTNNNAADEPHPFTMAAGTPAGDVWLLSGSAALVAPSVRTSSPASITVPAGTSGTIRIGPAPVSGSATAVPTLNEWALLLLALGLAGVAGLHRKRGV